MYFVLWGLFCHVNADPTGVVQYKFCKIGVRTRPSGQLPDICAIWYNDNNTEFMHLCFSYFAKFSSYIIFMISFYFPFFKSRSLYFWEYTLQIASRLSTSWIILSVLNVISKINSRNKIIRLELNKITLKF